LGMRFLLGRRGFLLLSSPFRQMLGLVELWPPPSGTIRDLQSLASQA
jgi:hypothetical protein